MQLTTVETLFDLFDSFVCEVMIMFDILRILINGETKYIDFKEKYSKIILKTVSAFSNYHDGKIQQRE